ncbi:hypothetical protein P152DRAFT_185301 [Eremomyces bilateralis CBS 781.70]|uniref:Cytoplasmic tRNA 2-thiolation protein 2 n=1 Tax=Eremomyces bilateralis CBS 781.70 TaxID=1392243 RepID=A0A6G1GC06_9PEZI|nr:uncharacterized protein P152DRAFT_185301 [Eremomyces bilateralis CBS 781.70]KAF1815430.1 hypothetical protein P152DRAFT_185301 [Eremomyces bilateralis CBS 781.70]
MEGAPAVRQTATGQNEANRVCVRCKEAESVTTIRSEPLCKECFKKYIHTKVVKRMETFRVRNVPSDGQRRLLLPLSLGISSLTLLHVLHLHLARQKNRTGQTGFDLIVLWIDLSHSGTQSRDPLLDAAKRMFPQHTFISSSITDVWTSVLSSLYSQDTQLGHDGNLPSLPEFLSSLPSATSRADVSEHFKKRLVVNIAKHNNCEAVLWGHTATRLAEQTLAETAKGRGFSLSGQISDGDSALGIPFYYPLRDLFRKELVAHAELVEGQLCVFLGPNDKKQAVSTRDSSIDALMTSYIDSVERGYPSIVANVVRTAGEKLTKRPPQSSNVCAICLLPYHDDLEPTGQSNGNTSQFQLCYGCRQSVPQGCLTGLFEKPSISDKR